MIQSKTLDNTLWVGKVMLCMIFEQAIVNHVEAFKSTIHSPFISFRNIFSKEPYGIKFLCTKIFTHNGFRKIFYVAVFI